MLFTVGKTDVSEGENLLDLALVENLDHLHLVEGLVKTLRIGFAKTYVLCLSVEPLSQ
jgi:hypothetical protein